MKKNKRILRLLLLVLIIGMAAILPVPILFYGKDNLPKNLTELVEETEEAFPGYEAPTTALEMANYIYEFALTGNKFYNGKMLQVSSSTP